MKQKKTVAIVLAALLVLPFCLAGAKAVNVEAANTSNMRYYYNQLPEEAKQLYGVEFAAIDDIKDMDAVIIAVAHEEFLKLTREDIDRLYNPANETKILADIKGIFDKSAFVDAGYSYWRL